MQVIEHQDYVKLFTSQGLSVRVFQIHLPACCGGMDAGEFPGYFFQYRRIYVGKNNRKLMSCKKQSIPAAAAGQIQDWVTGQRRPDLRQVLLHQTGGLQRFRGHGVSS